MAKEDMKKVGFNLHTDVINKLDEALSLKNKQLSVTGSTINKQELVEEMINEYYYRLQGNTKDADTVNKINTLVDDSVEAKFDSKVIKKIEQILSICSRNSSLMEMMIRTTCGTYDEQIKRRMGDGRFSREEAEESLNDYITNQLFKPAIFVEVLDAKAYDDGSPDVE